MIAELKDQSIRLADVFRPVFRRWRIVVVFLVLVPLAAFGYWNTLTSQYTATAELTVNPITINPFNAGAVNQQINITTEREILGSREVARMAAEELDDGTTPADLLKNSEIAAPSGSQVLKVSVTSNDPQSAADHTNAIAQAYLQFRAGQAAEVASGYIAELDTRISVLEEATADDIGIRAELSALYEQRSALALVSNNPGTLIGIASPPSEPSSQGPLIFITVGIAGALLLGAAAALLRDRTDRLLHDGQRMGEKLDESVIMFASMNDTEAYRWVLRSVVRGRTGQGKGIVTAVFGVASGSVSNFVTTLAETARASRLKTVTIAADTLTEDAVDAGWASSELSRASIESDLVLLDGSSLRTGSRRAALADHISHVIIVGFSDSRIADLEALVAEVSTVHEVTYAFCPKPSSVVRAGDLAATRPPQAPPLRSRARGADEQRRPWSAAADRLRSRDVRL